VYAADAAEQKAKREREEAERREKEKINPFSVSNFGSKSRRSLVGRLTESCVLSQANHQTPGPFGSTLFGGNADGMPTFNPFSAATVSTDAPAQAFSALSLSTPKAEAPSKAELQKVASGPDTPGKTLSAPFPAYLPAQYLTTFDEYLPADPNALAGDTAQRVKQITAEEAKEKEQQAGKKGGNVSGAGAEQWEKVLPKGVDEVFERFLERLNRAEDGSGQVLRYDLGAVPLPYSSHSELFKQLFKKSVEAQQDEDEVDANVNVFSQRYDPSDVVPACPRCGGKRTFEMQLTPGLIAELKTESISLTGEKDKKRKNKKKQTDEERRRELAVLLGRASAKDMPPIAAGETQEDDRTPVEREEDQLRQESGMEWGTVMVFGCEQDCVGFGEEWVGVEWEEIQ
jgi:pre-rRNA-processing protein TSR4